MPERGSERARRDVRDADWDRGRENALGSGCVEAPLQWHSTSPFERHETMQAATRRRAPMVGLNAGLQVDRAAVSIERGFDRAAGWIGLQGG
jgi:hypothetical protein